MVNTAKDMGVHLRENIYVGIYDDEDAGNNILIPGSDHPLDDFYVDNVRLMCGELADAGKFIKVQLKQGGNALTDAIGCTQGAETVGMVIRPTIDPAYNPVPAGVDLIAVVTEDTTTLDAGVIAVVAGHFVEAA